LGYKSSFKLFYSLNRILVLTAILLFFNATNASSQAQTKHSGKDSAKSTKVVKPFIYLGPGLGLDYGGVGVKFECLPAKFLGLFAGGGWNIAGLAYNAGVSVKMAPRKIWTPVIVGMYGYNGVLAIKNPQQGWTYRLVYYGFSAGAGFEGNVGEGRRNKYSIMVFYPFREEFNRDANDVKAFHLPFTVSFGLNFGIY
jgi:hypothetical protein